MGFMLALCLFLVLNIDLYNYYEKNILFLLLKH